MKDCTNCKHAKWETTKIGRLHKSGYGLCEYPWKMPPLPAAMYWMQDMTPKPYGGPINRHKELEDHCAYFARKESP